MNHVSMIGNLTRDPELKTVKGDRKVCDLRVAVNDGREDREPLYIDISTFDASAEACAKYLAKGRKIAVDGRLVYREWEDDDGGKHSRHSVIGRVEFLGSKPQNGNEPESAGAAPEADEDIPF